MTGKPYRLLTEAEWEYAARAGSTTAYFWGDEIGKDNANCNGCGSQWDGRQTSPVGSFKPNAFGLYDMAGNVWQWVQDCYHDNYNGAPTDGSAWTSGDCNLRVVRGGSFIYGPRALRAAARIRDHLRQSERQYRLPCREDAFPLNLHLFAPWVPGDFFEPMAPMMFKPSLKYASSKKHVRCAVISQLLAHDDGIAFPAVTVANGG